LRLDSALVAAVLRPLLLSWQPPAYPAARPAGGHTAAATSSSGSSSSSSSSSSSGVCLTQRVALARHLCKVAGLHRIQAEQVRLGPPATAATLLSCHIACIELGSAWAQ
jgi:hypothetical protein